MMNYTLSKIVIFTAGAIVGSAVTWKYFKTRYERITKEEIDSMKEFYSRHYSEKKNDIQTEDLSEEPSGDNYEGILDEQGYASGLDGLEKNEEVRSVGEPYVISPSEFGENDYETISLTYYADGVLADDMDEVIEDVDDIVGLDSLNHFGEYEEDSVFVRNDRLECDYEILLDTRKYENVKKLYRSHRAED